MKYTEDEIRLTLELYPISKLHLNELNYDLALSANKKEIQENIAFYLTIINRVDSWLNYLLPYEKEIIDLRIDRKKSFDFIAIQLGYANHSSTVRMYKQILKKIYTEGNNNG